MNIILFEGKKIPEKLSIKDERAKHILKILKLKAGDKFSCGSVNGSAGKGTITAIDSDWIYFKWEQTAGFRSLYPLTLLIGYTRPISSKRILREAASLGVEKIIFIGTDTGEKSYRDSNLWKGEYKKYLLDGAQQAASTGVPDVEFYKDLQTFFRDNTIQSMSSGIDTGFSNTGMIVLDNIEPSVKLSEYTYRGNSCLLSIGSERGWSARERDIFRKHQFVSASLGSRVLRTETASTAGISLMLARMGLL
ncbi:MAG: 16S rRNA (uracil(1498)-N(3))-methyltransferase [Spirochaetales bacterium]|nr:16S rRNA (uracil(1498)-N(3))-methyltransferase [Spirochaetales bacterium]